VLDLVGAIRLDPDLRMEDVLRALDSMTPEELEELATLLDEHDAAVRRRARRDVQLRVDATGARR
jgi:hypothetical protein